MSFFYVCGAKGGENQENDTFSFFYFSTLATPRKILNIFAGGIWRAPSQGEPSSTRSETFDPQNITSLGAENFEKKFFLEKLIFKTSIKSEAY